MNMVQYFASRVSLLAVISLLTLSLTGCEGDDGDPGAPGAPGSPGTSAPGTPASATELNMTITGVSINSAPVVNFAVTNEVGVPIAGLTMSNLRFTIAKLVPGSLNEPSAWQSYINQTENIDSPPIGPGTVPTVQATYERNNGGLVDHLNGNYTYTFSTDVANVTTPIAVGYDPSLTHRVAVQLSGGGLPVANTSYTWRPSDNATSGIVSREIVKTETCNQCHGKLALHGSGRTEVKYCVTCHNPGTVDANSTNTVDFKVMIHKIHRGEFLPSVVAGGEYAIWGFRDSKHDYSTVVYPQEIRNCTKCHDPADADTPDAGNWETVPSMEACGACHDEVDFANGINHSTQTDNSLCITCHVAGGFAGAVAEDHQIPAQVAAADFVYNIISATYAAGTVDVTFEVTNPATGNRYDLLPGAVIDPWGQTANGDSRLALVVGYDTVDYNNTDSGATTSPFAPGQTMAFPEPGLPISIDVLISTNVTATPTATGPTYTASLVLPAAATGSGTAALEGHPAVAGERVPVKNTFKHFAITDATPVARRKVVDIAKCNQCHGTLALHGNNRTDEPQVCVICHNPNATDIIVRPATVDVLPAGIPPAPDGNGIFDDFTATGLDGQREQAIDFKMMIHGIHAGAQTEYNGDPGHGFREKGLVVWGFGRFTEHDYSHVRFPGVLSNCETCHSAGTYELPLASGVLGTTIQSGDPALDGTQPGIDAALVAPTDDLNITPTAAVCTSCHDGFLARVHMEQNGAWFDVTQALIGSSSAYTETCAICHAPGRMADVKEVHGVP